MSEHINEIHLMASLIGKTYQNPTLEHYWITFDGDANLRMCARCEAQYPTDAPCINALLPIAVLEERVAETIAAIAGMPIVEAKAGLAALIKRLMKQ